jgi:hypothetical protein
MKNYRDNPVAMPTLGEYIKALEGLEDNGDVMSRQVDCKPIEGYEGDYDIYTDGRVFSYKSNRFLSPSNDKDGYKKVVLCKNGIKGHFRVCRLVAKAFVANPANYHLVNHLDEDKANDNASNLEWTDNYGNWKHSEDSMPVKETAVIKLTLDGDYICEYKGLMDAARDTGVWQGNISNCLSGRCKSTGGYRWIAK